MVDHQELSFRQLVDSLLIQLTIVSLIRCVLQHYRAWSVVGPQPLNLNNGAVP